MSASNKYIAEGFMKDALRLFTDFAKLPDNDFKTFCEVWKKQKFVHIFMGRPDYKEFREFTSEIYQLTLNYMMSSSTESQIAAIYLLYALYRNQDVISPVRIRISQLQYETLQHIQAYSVRRQMGALHYIIDYLKKNCFELVSHGSLYGPCCSKNRGDCIKPKQDQFGILSDLKLDITIFQESNIIRDLKNMQSLYLKQKDSIMTKISSAKDRSGIMKDYEKYDVELEILAHGRRLPRQGIKQDSSCNIGSRRMELKNSSFRRKAMFRYLNLEDETFEDPVNNVVPIKRKRQYKKRIPVNQRRVGRPKKFASRGSSDESESEDCDVKFSTRNTKTKVKCKRGPIGRRKVSYLKKHDGPVILESPKVKQEPKSDQSSEISDESSDHGLTF